MKAVENGGTAIGIRCKDGVVLAVEKIITSKLLKPGANKKIATVDRHVGIVRHTAKHLAPWNYLHYVSLLTKTYYTGVSWIGP